MKKVKITLRPGSSGKKFYLFPSPESLYFWMTETEKGEQVVVQGIDEFVLEPGGYIEAELRGFEYAYEGGPKFRRLELIRLGLAQTPKNGAGLLVTTHIGWVTGGLLPMKAYADSDIDVKLLAAADAKLDLPALFKDEVEESKKEEGESAKPESKNDDKVDDESIDVDLDELNELMDEADKDDGEEDDEEG